MTRKHGPAGGLAVAASIVAAAVAIAGCGTSTSTGDSGSTTASSGKTRELAIQLTDSGCSPAKATIPAGSVKIVVSNPSSEKTDEVELKNEDGIIMGERENLAPGLSGDFTLNLEPGTYVLNCTFQNAQRDNGTVTVTGETTNASSVPAAELDAAVAHYRKYVEQEAQQLLVGTKQFVAALNAGDVQKAKDLFGATRSHYEAIEPIAESFGNLDPEIDARINDVSNPKNWTGFHRIEKILWDRNTTKGTGPYAKKLLADVTKLRSSIGDLKLQAAQVANGAVGLLDEVSASKITGEEDRYSHTDLADFEANLTGAEQAFEALKPVLVGRGDGKLADQIQQQFDEVQKGLARYKRNTPLGFALYSELTPQDRRQFAQQVTALAEPLSLVAGKVLQPS